jgi:hypothetical protein
MEGAAIHPDDAKQMALADESTEDYATTTDTNIHREMACRKLLIFGRAKL